ncbi:MAG: hypothetical protein HYZ27_03290 [Deltaproteobacteria bacterium]|nr:hypothetical protein [Deltaproteobacteria bacterium]
MKNEMWLRMALAGALLLVVPMCSAEKGDCPNADDCACPCSDKDDPVCSSRGKIYQNTCVAECDGATVEECPGGADCAAQCEGAAGKAVCGELSDGSFECFDNACFRDCAGAAGAGGNKCNPRC